MKHLISHLLKNNLEEIVSKSLLHCHCKGLHSIMLLESPGKTIRLFISTPESEMYKNLPEKFRQEKMSIAFHPHHCNVTLHVIEGYIVNWVPYISKAGHISNHVSKFKYHSKITEGETAFELMEDNYIHSASCRTIAEGDKVSMSANLPHTVGVPKGKLAAWFVYEGKEDPNYEPYCWSNHDVRNQDFSELYQKPIKKQVLDLLTSVGLK